MEGIGRDEIESLVITASGGPFRDFSREELRTVTAEEALCHPTWQMGRKVTIDSATLMNKGLEVIEARWLFDMSAGEDRGPRPSGEHRSRHGSVSSMAPFWPTWPIRT